MNLLICCLLEQSSPCIPGSHVQFPVVLSQTPALLQSSGHFNPTIKKLGYQFEYAPSSLIFTREFSGIAKSIIWLDVLGLGSYFTNQVIKFPREE